MVEMKDASYGGSCVSSYDSNYTIGFFLSPKQVEALGISPDIQPDTMIKAVVNLRVASVTKRTDETELYATVCEMGIVKAEDKPSPKGMMEKAYKENSDVAD